MKKLILLFILVFPVFVYGANPPVITHTPLSDSQPDNVRVMITATVADDTGVISVWLYYREAGQTAYNTTAMIYSANSYYGYIPQCFLANIKVKRVEYFIDAIDYDAGGYPAGQTPGTRNNPNVFNVSDVTPPQPPLEPECGVTSEKKACLKWYHSTSSDVIKYNIYTDNGSGTLDYSNRLATVNYPDKSWVSAQCLDPEKIYKYAVRTVDSGGNEEKNIWILNIGIPLGTWKETTELPYSRHGYYSFVAKNKIFVAGGGHTPTDEFIPVEPINGCRTVYSAPLNNDRTIGAWSLEPQELPGERCYAGGAFYNDYVYIIGGLTTGFSDTAQSTVFYTRINADGSLEPWKNTTQIPMKLSEIATAVIDGYIYVIGGMSLYWGTEQRTVIYARINEDGTLGSWQYTTQLPDFRFFHNTVTNGRDIYVLGGLDRYGSCNTVFRSRVNSDGTLGPWTSAASLPQVRASGAATVLDNKIYWAGGFVFGPYLNYLNCGDTKDTVWYSLINPDGSITSWNGTSYMPGERQAIQMLNFENTLYIAGGLEQNYDEKQLSKHKNMWYVDTGCRDTYKFQPSTKTVTGTIIANITVTDTKIGRQLRLDWTNPSDADFNCIRIYRSTVQNIPGELVYDNIKTNSMLDTGLLNGVTYFYTIRSVDTQGCESENTEQVMGIPHDETPPDPPGSLTGFPDLDGKVHLNWTPSQSVDAAIYSIYFDNASGTINYSNPVATVYHPAGEWISGILSNNTTYKFGIRAKDLSGNEEKNTDVTVVVLIQIDGKASAVIKEPKENKRIRGNAVTIMANATDNTTGVLFQYRMVASTGTAWADITSVDMKPPYAVYWNVSALPNGEYNLRAVAYDGDNTPDLNPEYITVFIDDVNCDIIEDGNPEVDPNNEHRKTQKINPGADEEVILADGTEVLISAGTFEDEKSIIITDINSIPCVKTDATIKPVGVYKKFEFSDGSKIFAKPITITIPYPDENNDGLIDGTKINKSTLIVMYFDETGYKWEKITNKNSLKYQIAGYTRLNAPNSISIKTVHFTIFGLFYYSAIQNLDSVRVFPNPCRNEKVNFGNLTVKSKIQIYTISGELVNVFEETDDNGVYEWDTLNRDNQKVTTGIYLYIIKSPSGEKKTGKLAIIR